MSITSLSSQLQDRKIEWPDEENTHFIPINAMEELVTCANVREELEVIYPETMDEETLDSYANSICSSRMKLFTILLCGSGLRRVWIRDFVDKGITDSDLPFERYFLQEEEPRNQTTRKRPFRLCSKRHAESDSHPCAVTVMQNWPQREIGDFCRDQWMVQSPVFRRTPGGIPHYELDNRIVMPFEEDYESDKTAFRTGGYSDVWPVRICAGHQDLYRSSDQQNNEPLLAVKRLFSSNPHDFNQETRMLKSLTMENHKNLVELVATYKYKGKYHLLFPYAEANLRSLWESICMPYWNEETYLWVLDQMTGLASALNVIHTYQSNVAYNADLGNPGLTRFKPAGRINLDVAPAENKFGRHGDLKPENILWYIEVNKPGTTSVLQITDLGLGRFHRLESRSRVDPKTVAGSQTYMPPELPLNKLVSRKYDIWSLGCVFLEFITWLIRGSAGLENFNNLRLAVALDKVEDDTYYTLVPDGGHMRVVIREAVTSWTKDLHASPRCSKMVHEVLELVQNQLLVVDSHGRIAAQELYSELRKMLERSRKEIEYLVGRNPADKGRGFKMPDSQTM